MLPASAQAALTALDGRTALPHFTQPLHVQYARRKESSGSGGGSGGSQTVSTYEVLERELAGGAAKSRAGGAAGAAAAAVAAEDGESFDVTLLCWKPEVAKSLGLTVERAVKVRRRCTRFCESMREATEGMYVMPTDEDAVQPDRDPINYDDLSTPYA